MLRGAIDMVEPHKVGGWIYSDLGPVTDRTVLAFLDRKCIGSGRVELVREDLRAAGLGDGRLGFSFPISVAGENELSRVIVKLEGSDLALLQPEAWVGKATSLQPIVAGLDRIDWLRRKGLLAPAELTFLKYVQQMGVFDHSLIVPRTATTPRVEIADPKATAQTLFDLLCLRHVELREINLVARGAEDLCEAMRQFSDAPLRVIALHSEAPGQLAVAEGSHADVGRGSDFSTSIDYHYGPDRLLFLDLEVQFRLQDPVSAPVRIFCGF